jgi:hypothetical protein
MNSEENKPSNGQLFKEKVGYSKTMKRNMAKHGVETPEDYRKIRKARKKRERAVQAEKHRTAKLNRGKKAASGKTGKK